MAWSQRSKRKAIDIPLVRSVTAWVEEPQQTWLQEREDIELTLSVVLSGSHFLQQCYLTMPTLEEAQSLPVVTPTAPFLSAKISFNAPSSCLQCNKQPPSNHPMLKKHEDVRGSQ